MTSLTLLSLMMTLLLYCRWWCGQSSSYLDQLTGCTLSVLVLVTAYHSGLHSALSPDNPWTETECGASQVRGEERGASEWRGGRGEIVSRRTGRAQQPAACWVWLSVHTGPVSGPGSGLHLYHGLVTCVMCHQPHGLQPPEGLKQQGEKMDQLYHRQQCCVILF